MAFGNKKHKARSTLPSIPLLFDLLLSFALQPRKLSKGFFASIDQLASFTSDAFFLCYARGRERRIRIAAASIDTKP
ncbi:hypothetical protein HBH98_088280 [Parastagonospora nodorum]|nr:hypothetical protein HBI10_115060 [Parastagonospora nodorum]KAH4013204.1 hypothetical protein HBI13_181110 [Parastagonospora nodorum]KAH4035272.1 hypothetical protein HBI09_097510 [Parastagonospora nodorum]KAH4347986.1 hypothetical protein HBH98_088280 [Parastagonospora nodorum]KAH4377329.1 hypothetical protein HBH97_107680 [Parastagonospora nodorum]